MSDTIRVDVVSTSAITPAMRKWLADEASHWANGEEQCQAAFQLRESASPLFSLSYITMVFELISELQRLEPGQALDHPWGFVKRVDDGFRLAHPREAKAEGNWCGAQDDFVRVATMMFDQYAIHKGLVSA